MPPTSGERNPRRPSPGAAPPCEVAPEGTRVQAEGVPEWLKCAVCLEVLAEPVSLRGGCSHTFCRGCLVGALRRARRCPTCRGEPMGRGTVEELVVASVPLQDALADLKVHCRFGLVWDGEGSWVAGRGEGLCPAVLRPGEAAAHEAACLLAPVVCEYEGCGAVVARGAMAEHCRASVESHLASERAARVRLQEQQEVMQAFGLQAAAVQSAEIAALRGELQELREARRQEAAAVQSAEIAALRGELQELREVQRQQEALERMVAQLQAAVQCGADSGGSRPAAPAASPAVGRMRGWQWWPPSPAPLEAPGPAGAQATEVWVHRDGVARLVSGGGIGYSSGACIIRVWRTTDGHCERVLEGHTSAVCAVADIGDGRVVSGSPDKTLRVWRVDDGACERVLEGHTSPVCAVAYIGGGRVVSGSEDSTLRVWRVEDGACERVLQGHRRFVLALAFIGGGRVVSGCSDQTLRVWRVDDGACERVLEGHVGPVMALAFVGGGRVVSGSTDMTLRVWRVDDGACERVLEGHVGPVMALAFVGDGRVVSGSTDMTLRVWRVDDGACERVLEGHVGPVYAVAQMPVGRVVSGSGDGRLCVWRVADGACELTVWGQTPKVQALAVLSGA